MQKNGSPLFIVHVKCFIDYNSINNLKFCKNNLCNTCFIFICTSNSSAILYLFQLKNIFMLSAAESVEARKVEEQYLQAVRSGSTEDLEQLVSLFLQIIAVQYKFTQSIN